MQKIVHLIFTLESGGSENMLVDIANEQANHADVSIILINNKYSTPLVSRISNQVHFYSLNRAAGNKLSPMFLIRLWKLLKLIQPDVIHCHNHKIIQLLPWHRHKAMFTAHCLNVPPGNLKKYKAVYAISQAVADDIKKRSGITATVILNGIDFSMLHPVQKRRDLNAPFRVVQIGRLVHELKGQDILLHALKEMRDTKRHAVTIDFIGSGPSLAYLQNLCASLQLQPWVRFLGEKSRDEIYEQLPTYDVLVQPSRMEGFGLTLLEGIAAGLPVIANGVNGPAEILKDIPSSRLYAQDQPAALAHSLHIMCNAINEGAMRAATQQARTIVTERYSIKSTALNYLKSYTQLLQPKAVTI